MMLLLMTFEAQSPHSRSRQCRCAWVGRRSCGVCCRVVASHLPTATRGLPVLPVHGRPPVASADAAALHMALHRSSGARPRSACEYRPGTFTRPVSALFGRDRTLTMSVLGGKPFVPLDGTTGILQKNAKHFPTLQLKLLVGPNRDVAIWNPPAEYRTTSTIRLPGRSVTRWVTGCSRT